MVALGTRVRRTGQSAPRPAGLDGLRAARHSLVTAGQRLLVFVQPLREPVSRLALTRFVQFAASCPLSSAETDAVLLRLLAVLDPITGSRLPSLVDRYLAGRRRGAAPVMQFSTCVDDSLRYRGVGDHLVQRAIAIIEDRHTAAGFSAASPAQDLGVSQSHVCVRFKRQTGITIGTYLRNLRLDRAAAKLTTTDTGIKTIWIEVGYRHDSNFNHDFKQRFGLAPGEYRARAIVAGRGTGDEEPPAGAASRVRVTGHARLKPETTKASLGTVLVVDDDEGTSDRIRAVLTGEGFDVVVAENGRDGLRQAARVKPDTVLLDYWLGDIDGLAWLRALRRQPNGATARVVLWSADWDLDIAREAGALGALYVEKCCGLEQIRELAAPSKGQTATRPARRITCRH